MRPKIDTGGERGSALIVAMLLVVLMLSLGAALLAMSETESVIAANDQWTEGAFHAAEAAVQVAIDQISRDAASVTLPVASTVIGGSFSYRSGGRDDESAQPPQYVTTVTGQGFALGEGTGYNAVGYVFEVYQLNGTGAGPRNAQREVEVQVEVGPLAR